MESLERFLTKHPFFAGIDREHVLPFVGCARNLKWEPGSYVFREGEEATEVYLVREGRIAVELARPGGEAIVIETLDAGDVLGWSWLLPPYRWHFDARVVEPGRAISLDGACLRRKADADPAFGYLLMRRMCDVIARRLVASSMQILDVYGPR